MTEIPPKPPAPDPERWPRIRFGEREPIPSYVRRLVFERDGCCCRACGRPLTIRTAQLDHIVPWSAGGSDASDNLRVLCQPCNDGRSNFRGPLDTEAAARRVPVTAVCVACFHLQTGDEEPAPVIPGMIPAYCGWCGVISPTCPETVY